MKLFAFTFKAKSYAFNYNQSYRPNPYSQKTMPDRYAIGLVDTSSFELFLSQQKPSIKNKIEELISIYGSSPNNLLKEKGAPTVEQTLRISPVVSKPLALQPTHLKQHYQSSWQALLRAPLTKEIKFMGKHISRALGIIAKHELAHPSDKNSTQYVRSVIESLKDECMSLAMTSIRNKYLLHRKLGILASLNRLWTHHSMQTLLDCFSFTLEQEAEHTTHATNFHAGKVAGKTWREWITHFLTPQLYQGLTYQHRNKEILLKYQNELLPLLHKIDTSNLSKETQITLLSIIEKIQNAEN